MQKLKAGNLARSHVALTVFTATVLVGGTATEASASGYRHHHHHHRRLHRGHDMSGTFSPQAPSPMTASGIIGRVFSGLASFYGNGSGRQTASGQRFDQNKLTCAHRTLPFGTKLRVTHGGRSVVVTVNDRGPFVHGRVLDLSTAAARAVGLTSAGVGRVTAEVIS